jgi:hypothetical protein
VLFGIPGVGVVDHGGIERQIGGFERRGGRVADAFARAAMTTGPEALARS